jgi:hypothetical protein
MRFSTLFVDKPLYATPPKGYSVSDRRQWRPHGQLFNFQSLAPRAAGSLFPLFTYSSRHGLFINQPFFEQHATAIRWTAMGRDQLDC